MSRTPYFIQLSDFVGELQINIGNDPQGKATSNFNDIAAGLEEEIMLCVLNAGLMEQLINDLDSNNIPQTSLLYTLVFGGYYTNTDLNNERIKLKGLKEVIKHYVYSGHAVINAALQVQTGVVSQANENSTVQSLWKSKQIKANPIFNKMIPYYKQLVDFIDFYEDTLFDNEDNKTNWMPCNLTTKGLIRTYTMHSEKQNIPCRNC